MRRLSRSARRTQADHAGLMATAAGSSLLVHARAGATSPEAVARAARLPADPGRTVVAVDIQGRNGEQTKAFWTAAAQLLADRGPLRLAVPCAAIGTPRPAQLLSDRLHVEVLAPAGALVTAR